MHNRTVKLVIAVLSSVIAIIAVFSIVRAGFAFWLYSYISQWVTVRLGLDYYAAELLTVVITTAIMFFIPGCGSLIISRRKRLASAGLVIGGYVMMCALVYTVGRNVYFSRVNGAPLRYYADTPQGREFSFMPGFHPRYGVPFEPYTQAVVQDELRQMRLQQERRTKAEAEEQKQRARDEQKRLAEEQRRQKEEQLRIERQQALEQQQLAEAARRKEELELQQREAEAQRRHEQEMKSLEARQQANEQARELERQKLEAAERERECQERQRQEQEKHRRDQEARRRKADTVKKVWGVAQEIERKIRQRPN